MPRPKPIHGPTASHSPRLPRRQPEPVESLDPGPPDRRTNESGPKVIWKPGDAVDEAPRWTADGRLE